MKDANVVNEWIEIFVFVQAIGQYYLYNDYIQINLCLGGVVVKYI